jgi:hypothetical protein
MIARALRSKILKEIQLGEDRNLGFKVSQR